MSEEEKEQFKLLIEEYEENYKQSKYEGNVEDYESLKNTHKLLKDTLNYIDKLQKENKVLSEKNKYLQERLEFRVNYCNELEHELYEKGNYIHKEAIRKKIKELEQENKKHTFCRKADIYFNENAEMEILNTYAIMKLQDLLLEE